MSSVCRWLVTLFASRSLSMQSKILVNHEFSYDRVNGSEDGEANDDGERNQFHRNILELAQPL